MSGITLNKKSTIVLHERKPNKIAKAFKCLKKIFSKSVIVAAPAAIPLEPRSHSVPPRRVRIRKPKPLVSEKQDPLKDFAPHSLSPKLIHALQSQKIDPIKAKNWHINSLNPNVLIAMSQT